MYTKWRRWCIAIGCGGLAASSAVHLGTAGAAPSTGKLVAGSYSNAAGTIAYHVYVPDSYTPGTPVPLVVALHGCTQTGEIFRNLTRFDDLAAAKGFIVVFPDQNKSANNMNCWNWFKGEHMKRGAGEPSLIAGLTTDLQKTYTIDTHRTYVTGLSAGGAMAAVMGATYPDVYAAIGVGSGCEYGATATCAGYKSTDPEQSGRQAYDAMGSRARPVPFIVFQGDKDTTVPPVNAEQLVRSEQVTADWADDGAENGSIPLGPKAWLDRQAPGGRTYTVKWYVDSFDHELGQFWMVHGMTHAWSGGNPAEQYADPAGPDESAAMYAFFMDHPAP